MLIWVSIKIFKRKTQKYKKIVQKALNSNCEIFFTGLSGSSKFLNVFR